MTKTISEWELNTDETKEFNNSTSYILALSFWSLCAQLNTLETHSLIVCAASDGGWQTEELTDSRKERKDQIFPTDWIDVGSHQEQEQTARP